MGDDVTLMPFFVPRVEAAAAAAISLSFLGNNQGPDSDASSYTVSGATFGAEDATRHIIVSAMGWASGTEAWTATCTIGGVSATALFDYTYVATIYNHPYFWIAKVPTGTTGDIVITYAGDVVRRQAIAWWRAVGPDSISVVDTDSAGGNDSPALALDVQAGGAVVGHSMAASDPTDWAWTNLTEHFAVSVQGTEDHSAASAEIASTETGRDFSVAITGGAGDGKTGVVSIR